MRASRWSVQCSTGPLIVSLWTWTRCSSLWQRAPRWCRLAADQGDTTAQGQSWVHVQIGAGVTQDYVQAHMWLNLAASRSTGEGRERSVGLRDQIAEELTPAALNEAQRLAREWDTAHPREP